MTRRTILSLAAACLALAGCAAGDTATDTTDAAWAQMTSDQRETICSVTADEYAQLLTDQGVDDDQVDAEWAKHISTCG